VKAVRGAGYFDVQFLVWNPVRFEWRVCLLSQEDHSDADGPQKKSVCLPFFPASLCSLILHLRHGRPTSSSAETSEVDTAAAGI